MGCACTKSKIYPKVSVASTKPNQSTHRLSMRFRSHSEFDNVPILMHPINHPLYKNRISRLEISG